jgi:hypothetical protein
MKFPKKILQMGEGDVNYFQSLLSTGTPQMFYQPLNDD